MINNIDSKRIPFLAKILFVFFTAPLVSIFYILTSPVSVSGEIVDLFDRMTMRKKYLDMTKAQKSENEKHDNVIKFSKD